tara:strand:+ start:1836 stop:2240 length:405 start_codon:yes stop_codon:yes gene_type:complete
MEKYLYFRTQATIADDDDSAQSACFPLSSFLGMHPTADDTLTLFFIPQIRVAGGVTDGQDFTNSDKVVLTLGTANTHKAAMKGLIKAFGNASSFREDSADADFIVVADDISTGTSYITPEISAVSTIAIGAAFS